VLHRLFFCSLLMVALFFVACGDDDDDDNDSENESFSPPEGWRMELVDEADQRYYIENKIALRAADEPVILYYNKNTKKDRFFPYHLELASRRSSWRSETLLHEECDGDTSLVIDANDVIHFVRGLHDSNSPYPSDYILYYGNNSEGDFRYEELPPIASDGWLWNFSMALDSQATPHIIIGTPDEILIYDWTKSGWQTLFPVDTEEAFISIDGNDNMHFAFYVSGDFDDDDEGTSEEIDKRGKLFHVHNAKGEWEWEQLEDLRFASIGTYQATSIWDVIIDSDADGNTHLVYTISYDGGHDLSKIVSKYATNKSGEWKTKEFPDKGFSSFVLDHDANPNILIYDEDRNFHLLHFDGDEWSDTPMGIPFGISFIAIDSDNYVHLSYANAYLETNFLYYLTNRPE